LLSFSEFENSKESNAFLFHMNRHGLATLAALALSKKQACNGKCCGIKHVRLSEVREAGNV